MMELLSSLTLCRQILFSWLPPPVVAMLKSFDAFCYAKLGMSEASMTLLLTLIIIIGFSKVTTIILAATERRHNVWYDEDDGHLVTFQSKKGGSSTDERELCLLCGTTNSGKTTVFNVLMLSEEQWQKHPMPTTVTSMKALEGSIALPDGQSVRVVDFPGHLRLLHGLPRVASMANRIVFFLDSTKPVRDAATILYLLLTNHHIQNAWKVKSDAIHNDRKIPILIVCTKADLPRSKNCLRIKLQLKQELERMRKAKLARMDAEQRQEFDLQESKAEPHDEADIPLGSPDKNLDLDTCEDLPCQLTFTSIGFPNDINCKIAGESIIQLREFVTCDGNRLGKLMVPKCQLSQELSETFRRRKRPALTPHKFDFQDCSG